MHTATAPPRSGAATVDAAAAARTLRLARHLFGVEVAVWVALDARQPPVCDGPLFEAGPRGAVEEALRAVARRVVQARAGAIVGDTAALPVLAPIAGRFRFLAAAPIQPAGAALVLLDRMPRQPRPEDRAALADLVLLLDASPPAEGPVLVEHVPFPVGTLAVTEVGLVFEDGNAAAARYFDPTGAGLGGRTPREAGVPPEEAVRWTDAARRCLVAQEPVAFDTTLATPEGLRHLRVTLRPAPGSDAGAPRLAYVVEDVTERAEAEATLRRTSEEFERIFAASPDAILFAGPDRCLRRVNPAACRLFGYTEAELVGRPLAELYADPDAYARHHGGAQASGDRAAERVRWRRRDGSTFLGELTGATMGEEAGYVGIVRDVSEQVRAAEALREREALLCTVVENAPVLLFALDAEGRLTRAHGRALDAAGFDAEALVGRSVFEVYAAYPAVVEGVRCALGGETVGFTAPVHGRSFECRVAPVFGEGGAVAGAIGVAVDITERVRAEEALRAAHAEAEAARTEAEAERERAETARQQAEAARAEAEAARRQAEEAAHATASFLAAMSHEIRTPLTSVIGFADLLAEEASGEVRAYAELIQRGGRRLMETLNSVLDLARLDAEQVQPRRQPIDLGAEAAEAAALLRPLAERKGLVLRVEAARTPVVTDASLVHRVLSNLIGNAIKFTDAGEVVVTVAAEERHAVVRVEDTGRGISREFLPHLFEPFRREDDGAGRPSGTGLGLALTQRIVALLGGDIRVESEPGWGSTFTVRLPLESDPGAVWRPLEEVAGVD